MRVLLVEDDPNLSAAILQGLREENWLVDHAADGAEARLFVLDRAYDVIILDRLLPDTPGDVLLAGWRRSGLHTPLLLLTALDTMRDRVEGLRAGADDYLGKPFAFPELVARVEALARRTLLSPVRLEEGGLSLDPRARLLSCAQRTVMLTARECGLMEHFLRHRGQVLSRDQLAAAVWDEPWEASANLIEAHIRNLRRKLKLVAGQAWRVRTIRLSGYALVKGEDPSC